MFYDSWAPDHPGWVNHTNAAYERRAGLTGVEWDRIGIQTTIVTDMMWPEDVRETHRDGINAAYRDGHVTYIRDRRFEDWWQDDSWARPESQRRFLEMSSWVDRQGTR